MPATAPDMATIVIHLSTFKSRHTIVGRHCEKRAIKEQKNLVLNIEQKHAARTRRQQSAHMNQQCQELRVRLAV